MNEEQKKKIETLNSAFSMQFVPLDTYLTNIRTLLVECGHAIAGAKSALSADEKNRLDTLNSAYSHKFVTDDIYLEKMAGIISESGGVGSSFSSSTATVAPVATQPKKDNKRKADPDPVPVAAAVIAPTVPVAVPVVVPAAAPVAAPAVAVAPVKVYTANAAGKKELDIVLSFDTTGSMTSVIASVRKNLRTLTEMLFANTEFDVKMSVIAHGDYDHQPTLLQVADFSDNSDTLVQFIDNAKLAQVCWNDGEAYEQVLHRMKTLTWREMSRKICVMVGDDLPHEPTFRGNTAQVDWAECVATLTAKDVCFYAVQCASLSIPRARPFYRALAKAHVSGQYILLDQFYMMPELITGLMLKATEDLAALATLEASMKASGNFNRHMGRAFDILLGRAVPPEEDDDDDEVVLGPAAKMTKRVLAPTTSGGGRHVNSANIAKGVRVPVAPGRFQRLKVNDACAIKEFVLATGVVFKTGRGFYELTKKEDVSPTKEVVLEELATGDMFTGGEARSILGLTGNGTEKINPTAAGINGVYRAFIQSTSYNRKLMPDTWFLYEIDNV